jgi:hypothetical protein
MLKDGQKEGTSPSTIFSFFALLVQKYLLTGKKYKYYLFKYALALLTGTKVQILTQNALFQVRTPNQNPRLQGEESEGGTANTFIPATNASRPYTLFGCC